MFIFTSVNSKYRIYGEPVGDSPSFIAKFTPIGAVGRFATDSEELAEKLRNHPDFGNRFMEIGFSAMNPKIVKDIRSSESHPELGKSEFDPQKLIELGRLQATLLRKTGEYRKDASSEDIQKYELLKKELEK